MDDQRTDRGGGVEPDMGWELVGIVGDGEPIDLCGVNRWNFEWKDSANKEPVIVVNPHYSLQWHRMFRWEIEDGDRTIRFAAGEFSACVWAFYIAVGENLNPTC